MNEQRTNLLRTVVFETVGRVYPDQLNYLDGLWHSWVRRSLGRGIDPECLGGLAALGDSDEESAISHYLMIMSTFIGSMPSLDDIPDEEMLADGLRAAGAAWGLKGRRLEHAVRLGTSHFFEAVQLFANPNKTTYHERPTPRYWVLVYEGGIPGKPELMGREQPGPQDYPTGVDLIVDEPRGALVGSKTTVMLTDTTSRERTGLWLALTRSGKSFGHKDIYEQIAHGTIASEDMPRKYKMYGQRLCKKLTGLTVIPEGRGKRYSIAPEVWTWAWILETPEIECSILLNHDR